jgi:serine protease Do/serine protease DegQ
MSTAPRADSQPDVNSVLGVPQFDDASVRLGWSTIDPSGCVPPPRGVAQASRPGLSWGHLRWHDEALMISALRVYGAAALIALLTACAGGPSAENARAGPVVSAPAAPAGAMVDPARGVLSLAPLLERVTPAVVNIAVRSRVELQASPLSEDPFFRRFFDLPELPRQRDVLSAGSGVIVDAGRGYVTLKDRRTYPARLMGSDPETDIALLALDAPDLAAVTLGDSDRLQVGDLVIAIGNPFGLGQTVTSGIVSALGRGGLGIEGYEDFIQTDASINPGNSGGALVNSKGELVGINTAILGPTGGNIGIGFAVPVNMAHAVMAQLVEHGAVRRGRLGVTIQDLTPDLAAAVDLDLRGGALVTGVDPGSPAERAGLRQGDVIVQVNGLPIEDAADLRNLVGLMPVGAELDVVLYRDARRRSVHARVEAPVAPPVR